MMSTTKSDVPSENEPFGRQPQVVNVSMTGDRIDVDHYMQIFRMAAERNGDVTQRIGNQIRIYPRAVND
jgi:hypothetical protein